MVRGYKYVLQEVFEVEVEHIKKELGEIKTNHLPHLEDKITLLSKSFTDFKKIILRYFLYFALGLIIIGFMAGVNTLDILMRWWGLR